MFLANLCKKKIQFFFYPIKAIQIDAFSLVFRNLFINFATTLLI